MTNGIKIFISNVIPGCTVEKQFDVIEACAFHGTGLLTSICVGFALFFGKKSTKMEKKMELALNRAKSTLCKKASQLQANAIIDFRIVHLGNAVCVYGTPVKICNNTEQPLSDEMKEKTNEANEQTLTKSSEPEKPILTEKAEAHQWRCPSCGKMISQSPCPHCNNRLWRCPSCGKMISQNPCPHCNNDGERITCPICGFVQQSDRKCCWKCGVKFVL